MTDESQPIYFDVDGQPISAVRYVELSCDADYQRVGHDNVGRVEISTIWRGLDHGFGLGGPPLIFETIIVGGAMNGEQWRYATLEQARAGHEAVVSLVRHEAELRADQ